MLYDVEFGMLNLDFGIIWNKEKSAKIRVPHGAAAKRPPDPRLRLIIRDS